MFFVLAHIKTTRKNFSFRGTQVIFFRLFSLKIIFSEVSQLL